MRRLRVTFLRCRLLPAAPLTPPGPFFLPCCRQAIEKRQALQLMSCSIAYICVCVHVCVCICICDCIYAWSWYLTERRRRRRRRLVANVARPLMKAENEPSPLVIELTRQWDNATMWQWDRLAVAALIFLKTKIYLSSSTTATTTEQRRQQVKWLFRLSAPLIVWVFLDSVRLLSSSWRKGQN